MINLADVWMTQRSLKRIDEIPGMVLQVKEDLYLPLIEINRLFDGSLEIQNGHHRAIAYWLAGKRELSQFECVIIEINSNKRRFWKVPDCPSIAAMV